MIQKIVTSIFFCLLVAVCSAFSQTPQVDDTKTTPTANNLTYQFPNAEKRFRRYLNDTVGVGALIGTGIGAAFQQIDNDPPEWKKTGKGFARRLGSNFGQNAIEQTTQYGLSEVFRQDQKYQKCDCIGFSRRTIYALKSGFTARNRSGRTVFSPPKVVSPFVGSVAAVKLWYPNRYTVKDGLRRGGYGLVFNAGFNLIQEFIFKK